MNTATTLTHPSGAGAVRDTAIRPADDDALYRKVSWRLIPLLCVCYIFNHLDRNNVAFAQLQLKDQLGFSDSIFGLGAAIFFVGYALFEVPSNLLMAHIGARATLLRIMVLWGAVSTATMFVATPMQFYVARFLLGVFEAGFAPGVLFYLTLWYPSQRRAQINGLFFTASAAAPILAGPIAGLTMTYLDGSGGLRGWQWLFLIEGLPSVLLGFVAYRWLTNRPTEAHWLAASEQRRLTDALHTEHASGQATGRQHHQRFSAALRDPRVWLLSLVSFLIVAGIYALVFWQPTMLKSMGLSTLQIGFYSVVPALFGVASMLLVGRRSDRTHERRWHYTISAAVGAAGLSLTTRFMHDPVAAIACLSLAAAGISAAFAIFWAVPGSFLADKAAAGGIALISTLAGCGGVVAPMLVGAIKSATGGFTVSLYVLSGALVVSAPLLWLALRGERPTVGT